MRGIVQAWLEFAAVAIVLSVAVSCATTGRSDGTVLEHQRQVVELETANRDLQDRLDKYDSVVGTSVDRLEDLGTRASAMGSDIDELILLFNEYQRGVEQLIRDYNRIKDATKDGN